MDKPDRHRTGDAAAIVGDPAGLNTPDLAGLEPIERIRRRWPVVLGAVLSLLMIAGLARELFNQGLAGLSVAAPDDPRFYLFWLAAYIAPPLFDFLIFRKLWRIPSTGFAALVKKRIANDVVIGYSGDAFFYAWARQRMKMIAAPFGAVKDVAILSAQAGNAITLTMVLVAAPFAWDLLSDDEFEMVAWSTLATLGMTLPFVIFSKRVFSLGRRALFWIFRMQCLRILAGSLAFALAWHYAMPDVSLGMWLFLSAGRLLTTRLPLVPNKDLLFANFAIILIGQGEALSDMLAFTAALTLLTHGALIGSFGLRELTRREATRNRI